jgi:hypothetical protein
LLHGCELTSKSRALNACLLLAHPIDWSAIQVDQKPCSWSSSRRVRRMVRINFGTHYKA